jgi:hypothetical protein
VRPEEPPQLTLFDGVSADDLRSVFRGMERRVLADGIALLTECSQVHEMYVVERGAADALVTGPDGQQHHVNRLRPGGLLGEMSLLTGHVASATVRAVGQLEVLVIGDAQFEHLASAYPRSYHNVGAILSRKVFESDWRALQRGPLMNAMLVDVDAPPFLGYAVACSVAWHGRGPTLLLDLAHGENPVPYARGGLAADNQVEVRTGQLDAAYAPDQLPRVIS